MMGILKNTKWVILFYFLLIGAGVAVFLYTANQSGYIHIEDNRLWVYYTVGVLLFTGIAGYIAGTGPNVAIAPINGPSVSPPRRTDNITMER